MDQSFGAKFRIGRKIGAGAFGDIYGGVNIKTGEKVAIKLEPVKSENPVLLYEAKLYKLLDGSTGVPRIHWYGVSGDYNVMVMDLLGPSLEDLFCRCRGKFTLKTVLLIAEQILERIERVHSMSIVHRDIKPENFLVGQGDNPTKIFMIDFGCAKRYRDPLSLVHIPYKQKKALTGTVRYVSVNAHHGIEQSRRDDLESIGYMLMYFLRGKLPWSGLRARSTEEKYRLIADVKSATPVEELCENSPREFATYLNYCRRLQFEEKPDYSHLRSLFRQVFVREAYKEDLRFDWHLAARGPVEDGEGAVQG